MRTDPHFQKWCSWMKTVTSDVQMLYFYRDIFQKVHQIVEANERIDKRSLFFSFFANIYIDSVVMGIRRQLKNRKDDSVSLVKLLSEIAKTPELVSRQTSTNFTGILIPL